MFTPAMAFYSRQTIILPGLAADEGSYARGRKKGKKRHGASPCVLSRCSCFQLCYSVDCGGADPLWTVACLKTLCFLFNSKTVLKSEVYDTRWNFGSP